jgi:integrase
VTLVVCFEDASQSKGDPLELAVILGAFYGLRRSEVVGLKWDAEIATAGTIWTTSMWMPWAD